MARAARSVARRASVSDETIALIRELAAANQLWGAERIRGELLKRGIRVAKTTVQRHMRDARPPRRDGQTWATFLCNHAPRDLGLRLPAGHRSALPAAPRLLRHRARRAPRGACRCHAPPHGCLGRAAAARGHALRPAAPLPPPRQRPQVRAGLRPRCGGERHHGAVHGLSRPAAERHLRALPRQRPARMPGPCADPRRGPPAARAPGVCALLRPGPAASGHPAAHPWRRLGLPSAYGGGWATCGRSRCSVASTTRISERRSTDGQAKRPGQPPCARAAPTLGAVTGATGARGNTQPDAGRDPTGNAGKEGDAGAAFECPVVLPYAKKTTGRPKDDHHGHRIRPRSLRSSSAPPMSMTCRAASRDQVRRVGGLDPASQLLATPADQSPIHLCHPEAAAAV